MKSSRTLKKRSYGKFTGLFFSVYVHAESHYFLYNKRLYRVYFHTNIVLHYILYNKH